MLANLLRPRSAPPGPEERAGSFDQYWADRVSFAFNGYTYTPLGSLDHIASELATANAPLASVMDARIKVFSEARLRFQQMRDGRMGALTGNQSLRLLEEPWPGAGSEHLLAGMEMYHSIFGNAYVVEQGRNLVYLDPCKVTIMRFEVVYQGQVVGYQLAGFGFQSDPTSDMAVFLPDEVAHYRTTPDPSNPLRGTSWMRSVVEDAQTDRKMTGYNSALLDNSAVPGLVLRAEPGVSEEQFDAARETLKARHTGWDKVGRTLLLGAGFDAKVVGNNPQQMDIRALRGAGETRIASAAGVPVVVAGFSEGLQGSALTTGNYGAARRRFADGTIRPMWRAACTALSVLVPPPPGTRLWYDASDVSFLQEDEQDEATIRETKARTIRALVDGGYTPDAAAEFAQTGDETMLMGKHSGLYSVQLQEPGAQQPTP